VKKSSLILLFFSIWICLSAQVPSYVPKNGLLGWWPFNGNANDESGSSRNGVVDGASLTSDRFGGLNKAYSFDGINDKISFGGIKVNKNADKTNTVAFWMHWNGSTEMIPFCWVPNYSLYFKGGNFGINTYEGNTIGIADVNLKNKWVFVVAEFTNSVPTSTNCKLWINGIKQNISGIASRNINVSDSVIIGAGYDNGYYFQSYLDDVGIWNRPLEQCEILSLYRSEVVKPNPLTVSIGKDTQHYCNLDSVKINVTSGFKSYKWNTGSTGSNYYAKNTSIYSVAATDSQGCTVYDTAYVSIINPRISPRNHLACSVKSVDLKMADTLNSYLNCGQVTGPLKKGLVGWWSFCGNANDESGNGNHGTVFGPKLTTDRFGNINQAYWFNENDYIKVNPLRVLPKDTIYGQLPLTISFWAISNNKKLVTSGVVSLRNDTTLKINQPHYGQSFDVSVNSTSACNYQTGLSYHSGSHVGTVSYANTMDSNWHHYTMVLGTGNQYNHNKIKYYVDGNLITTMNCAHNWTSWEYRLPKMHLFFGKNTFNALAGAIDDIGIWNRALTSQEVAKLYTMSKPVLYTWSTLDTGRSATITKYGNNKIIVKADNRIGACLDTISMIISKPKVSIIQNDSVRCFGSADGRLIANAKNGISPYRFKWNDANKQATDTATKLKKGIYKVILLDSANCIDSSVALIEEPEKLVASILSIDSVKCYNGRDGAMYTKVMGGSKPYNLLWNDPARQTTTAVLGLVKGSYKLWINDANGCKDSVTANLFEPDLLDLSVLSIDSVNCKVVNSGKVITNTKGGNGNYRYLWSDLNKQTTPNASNLPVGIYKGLVFDKNGCKDSVIVKIEKENSINIRILSADSVTCFGYSDGNIITQTTGGGGNYTFQWDDARKQNTPNLLNVGKGKYTLTVLDKNGCADSVSKTLGEPLQIIPAIIADNTAFKDSYFSLNFDVNPKANYTVRWEPNAIFGNTSSQDKPKISIKQSSMIKLQLTDAKGCYGRDSVIINAINPLSDLIPTGFSPNGDGLNDIFILPSILEIHEFIVFNRWGEMVFSGNNSNNQWNGMTNNTYLPSGTYAYKITASIKGEKMRYRHSGNITLIR
jgi:gliding motility-associated-like protein